jgi:hypothetical protein
MVMHDSRTRECKTAPALAVLRLFLVSLDQSDHTVKSQMC